MDMSMLETIETDAIAPRLSDGTAVSELIDFERREVSLRVHHDQEIFDLEMERIFTRSWLPVAHESEIPNPGDFVRRYAGQDSCLVVRRDDGSRSEEHTSELQSLMRISYAVFCLKKKKYNHNN